MTDIAALIAKWFLQHDLFPDQDEKPWAKELAEAISRLSTPPLPVRTYASAEELDAILNDPNPPNVVVNPDGSCSPAPPLPEEIAKRISRLYIEADDCPCNLAYQARGAAEDHRALAQENERLKKATSFAIAAHDTQVEDKDTIAGWYANALERICELEAECDTLRNSVDAVRAEYLQRYMDATARIIELEAERDAARAQLTPRDDNREKWIAAIRANAIEECEQVAKLFEDAHDAEIASSQNPTAMLVQGRQSQVASDIAEAILDLKEPK
jgi:hypothetical protein